MDYAFAGGRLWKIIFSHALRAALVDPSNALTALRRLKGYVAAGFEENRKFWWVFIGLKSLSLPRWVRKFTRCVKGLTRPRTPNLLGDRDIEWSWLSSQMSCGPGEALDFGSGGSHLALIAAQRGFNVTAVDLESVRWHYVHPRLHFILGDILKLPLHTEHFDLIINCSTVEHVGLAGRYGVTEDRPDGDMEAMAHLRALIKPDGVMLLTIPVGQDAVFAPLTRVYGAQRLPQLLNGYIVEKEEFWIKDGQNRWRLCDKESALNFKASAVSWDSLRNVYALGCFVLRKISQEKPEDENVSPSAN
jgi:SAM-dependent methyltransferase